MKAVTREAMEEGAWGLSTGLDYPPGSYASTGELGALAEVAARMAATTTRTLAPAWLPGTHGPVGRGAANRAAGRLPRTPDPLPQGAAGVGSHLDYLGLVERGRDEGMDVTFDCYTYPYSGTTVTIGLPHWAKDGGP